MEFARPINQMAFAHARIPRRPCDAVCQASTSKASSKALAQQNRKTATGGRQPKNQHGTRRREPPPNQPMGKVIVVALEEWPGPPTETQANGCRHRPGRRVPEGSCRAKTPAALLPPGKR